MSGGFYRGTNIEQDGRFANKEKKLIRSREWPKEFESRVDIRKVNLEAFRPWVDQKIEEIMGVEDELVSGLCISELENCDEKGPDPRRLQINLTGFLSDQAGDFMLELWKLLLEAQDKESGMPDALVDQNKTEIEQKMTETEIELQKVQNMMRAIQEEKEGGKFTQVASNNEQSPNKIIQDSLKPDIEKYDDEGDGNEIDIDRELKRRKRRKKRKRKKEKKRRYRSRSSEKDRRRSRSEKRRKRRRKEKRKRRRYEESDESEYEEKRKSRNKKSDKDEESKERVRVRRSSSSSLSL